MAARITLKAINDEMARRGYVARLAKASGYFYFHFGEAANWLDRTVDVPTVSSRTLDGWIEEFKRLEQLNHNIMGSSAAKTPERKRLSRKER